MVITTNEMRGDEEMKSRGRLPIVIMADAIKVIGNFFVLCIRVHFAQVPQAKRLVLPVGNHVATVAFG